MKKVFTVISCLVVLVIGLILFGIYSGTAPIGDCTLGVTTLILALVTYETGRNSELISLEIKKQKRQHLERLLEITKEISATEDESICLSLSKGNQPQPQYNQIEQLSRNLDASDDKEFRQLVIDTAIEMQFDLSNEGQRMAHAKGVEDFYKKIKRRMPDIRKKWQKELMELN